MKLAIITFIVGALLGAFFNGLRLNHAYLEEKNEILEASRQKEIALQKENESLFQTLQKEKHENHQKHAALTHALDIGKLRFTTDVYTFDSTGVKTRKERAQLNEETTRDLLLLTREADDAILELNYCIDAYNALRK